MSKKSKTRSSKNNKVTIAVHSGSFHPDDVMAVAIMSLYLKKSIKIIRSRNPVDWAMADYILDVGGDYNPKKKIFDHHQNGWNEKRENGIVYASAGLIWKHFGRKISGSDDVWKKIDEKIIQVIDAEDNGMEIFLSKIDRVANFSFGDFIYSFNPTWCEKNTDNRTQAFKKAVEVCKSMLEREIKRAKDNYKGARYVRKIYQNTKDKRILVLKNDCSWKTVIDEYKEPLFVVSPDKENNTWSVLAVKEKGFKFKSKLSFPESWGGKKGEELAKETGICDAIFCHNLRFIAVAKSKQGAIELAKKAVSSYN